MTISGLAASYTATVGEAVSFEFTFAPSAAVPSQPSVTPPELALALTHDSGTATVTGTATHADTYTATFEFTHRARTDTHTTTITVACPAGRTQQPDRTCAAPVCTAPLGSIATGTLGPQSGTWERACVLPTGRRSGSGTYYAKHYTFTLTRRAQVTIDLTSDDQDTYLYLLSGHSPDGTELHHDDDSGTGRNSKLSVNLEAGNYTITASTYSRQRTGSFQVRVQASEPVVCTQRLGSGTINSAALVLGPQSGTWEPSCVLPSGQRTGSGTYYAKHYTFTLDADAYITIDLTSDDQDTYLFLLSGHNPDGTEMHHDDDSGTGRNSKLTDINLTAGDYTITATTYARQRTGNFEIRASTCTTDLGELTPTYAEKFDDVWSASDVCVSSQRGDAANPHYARFYTFKLAPPPGEDRRVILDLSSNQDSYLHLLRGHSPNLTLLASNNDKDATSRDAHLTRLLPAGSYTIESTTNVRRVEGDFTLHVVDPKFGEENVTVGEEFEFNYRFSNRIAGPQLGDVTLPELVDLDMTLRFGTAMVTGTAELKGEYHVPFRHQLPNGDYFERIITVVAECPEGWPDLFDRSCQDTTSKIPATLIAPERHWTDHHPWRDQNQNQHYPRLSMAALDGILLAAETLLSRYNSALPVDQHDTKDCRVIPQEFRLTEELFVGLLASIAHFEVYQGGVSNKNRPANSLMDLSRHDHANTRSDNISLYSFNTVGTQQRAFWHPAVGLWQLDGINANANPYNHAERAHAATAALTAGTMLLDNYCSTNLIEDELLDLATPGTDPTRLTREKKKELSIDRLKKSLYYGAWVACNKQNNERCFAMLENLLRGPLFPNDPNIDNTRWDTLYNGRLYLSIDSDITDPYGGGVKQRVCEWLKNGTRVGTTFECFTYNIADAQGLLVRPLHPRNNLHGRSSRYFGPS